jgi:sarcosine oxidase
MGSAACYYLAREGVKVLGLEQFGITHENGSHAGQSRLIRKAYFEHPGYVPLLERAYHNWDHLEDVTCEQVYYETGIFYAGSSTHPVIQGVHHSAEKYNIALTALNSQQVETSYAQFNLPKHYEAFIEPEAGFLIPEKIILLYVKKAKELGAVIQSNTAVIRWNKKEDYIMVETSNEIFTAKKIIICSGAFTSKLLPQYKPLLAVTRQTLAWVNMVKKEAFELGKFPCWIITDDEKPGVFYGFPLLPETTFGGPVGLKLAHHYPAAPTDPAQVNRNINSEDEKAILQIMDKYFRSAYTSIQTIKTCLYTNTPDEDFIIDYLPGYDSNVIVAAGFSGHGFKFASVIGEILADLAIDNSTVLPVEFLRINRFPEPVIR